MALPRICIATYFDGPFAPVGELCRRSLARYAERRGYDVAVFNTPLCDRPASWNKIPIITRLFDKGYEFVLWIDADAAFVRFDTDIAGEIREGKDWYVARVRYPADGSMANCGVMLVRNSGWTRALLARLWDMDGYCGHPWWENAAFLDLLGIAGGLSPAHRRALPAEVLRKKPDAALLQKIRWLDEAWNFVGYSRASAVPPVVRHYPCLPLYARQYAMARHLMAAGLVPVPEFAAICLRAVMQYLPYANRPKGLSFPHVVRALVRGA